MLSSRYLHLHEALGLGPMWLNQQAAVRPSETIGGNLPSAPNTRPQAAAQPIAEAVRSLSPAAHHARLAAAALVNEKKNAPIVPSAATSAQLRTHVENPAAQENQIPDADGLPPLQIDVKPSEIMVVSICPSTEDSTANQLFSGSVGVLLDNMLAAIDLQPQQAHKTCWVKSAPISNANPSEAQIEAAVDELAKELAQSQAKAVLFLGQIFEHENQRTRMQAVCGKRPYFVIPHPARLLRQTHLKAQAWAELKKLKRLLHA
ncbi:uracil-DNA glycosylase family protein [Neisseria weixii]|uniref:uracil-DNA glycosylase family protein n=1 Tax=Neisseria weixii TaxID=1853276 RepID=UPI000BB68436|nr:uracil-DNA glycosylase family protein [Neisseria weixii]ATD65855.1 uracil-DNA glycosylase [Neisseria weixii]